eukprot:1641695-Pleurochrysis_carterae.AAC.2
MSKVDDEAAAGKQHLSKAQHQHREQITETIHSSAAHEGPACTAQLPPTYVGLRFCLNGARRRDPDKAGLNRTANVLVGYMLTRTFDSRVRACSWQLVIHAP